VRSIACFLKQTDVEDGLTDSKQPLISMNNPMRVSKSYKAGAKEELAYCQINNHMLTGNVTVGESCSCTGSAKPRNFGVILSTDDFLSAQNENE
jgi:hypothetical protein